MSPWLRLFVVLPSCVWNLGHVGGRYESKAAASKREGDMDGRTSCGVGECIWEEFEFLSLLREVFEWPKAPTMLRAEIIRLIGDESFVVEPYVMARRSATSAPTSGVEPSTPMSHG